MTEISRLLKIRQKTLEELKQGEGHYWKEVKGELHAQNNEIPNWILLFETSDIRQAHTHFLDVIGPYLHELEDVNFTVSYEVYRDGVLWHLDDLMTNDEMLRRNSVGELGSRPIRSRETSSIFNSKDSKPAA